MSVLIQVFLEMVEDVASLRFPPKLDRRLQALMHRNSNGLLAPEEQEYLGALVELSETLALVRAEAISLLGRKPG